MIIAEGLTKTYGSLKAVDAVSFEVKTGEAFGLLGPNGAGKTTTLSMLVGAIQPDSGTVHFDNAKGADKSQIGLCPQSIALYDELTAKENLEFFGALYCLAANKLKERVNWALQFSGLKDRAGDRVRTFSGGMKRRLNLVCSLIHSPKLLVLDEPTVGVDPQSRNYIFEGIESLKKDGLTVIYTTHYMEEAQRLCDRVAIMDHGRILAIDAVEALLKTYAQSSIVVGELVRPFEGTPPVPGKWSATHFRIETAQPLVTLGEMQKAGVEASTIHIERPTLESVFLQLTGRSLRD